MNYIKKTILPFLLLWAFIPYGISQNEKSSFKPFYHVEANFGISTCIEREYINKIFESKLAYQTLVYGANFAGGIEFTHYFKAGLGLGYLYYKQNDKRYPYSIIFLPNSMTTHGIPLFLYLRSDFLDRKISPFVDIKIGNNFLITKETLDVITFGTMFESIEIPEIFKLKNGLFLSSNIGVSFKTNSVTTLNVSLGYRFVSRNYDMTYFIGTNNNGQISYDIRYVNLGNFTVDHQFVINLGVSF